MSFMNLALLGGAAAAVVPILVHLISKSQPREVKWGAMHLIELTLKSQQRRLRFENWLLMLLRCAIPVLLALCMARPIIKGSAVLWANGKTSLMVLLDNSYSLDFKGAGGTNFENARDTTAEIIKGMQRGSDVNIILMSDPDSPLYETPVFNTKAVAKEIAEMSAGFGQAQVSASLEKGAEHLLVMDHPHREMVLVTDLQRISWPTEEGEAALRTRVCKQLNGLEIPASLTLFHVGVEGKENVCVETLSFSHLLLGVNQTLKVQASLRNYGERSHDALRVIFHADGKPVDEQMIPLGAGERRQVRFRHQFDKPGSHVIEVITDADSLKADNIFRASIPVWDKVPVLVVNGDPDAEPLKGETDFLQIALQPYREGGEKDLTDLLETRVINAVDFSAAAIGQTRVVILANVSKLRLGQLNELQTFVKDGGGVLIFGGDQIDQRWYNDQLLPYGLLPARLGPLADKRKNTEPFTRIMVQRFDNPALEIFSNPRNGDLASAEIRQWHRTLENPDDDLVRPLARLETGDAFIIEKKYGNGRVLFCATACDDAWSTLPLRPFFVPFTQRLCTYLASSVMPPRNLGVGEKALAHFPLSHAGREITVLDTEGKEHAVRIESRGGRGVATFDDTARPGLYEMKGPDGKLVHFVVNTLRSESDLKQLSSEEQREIAETMGADLVTNLEEYRKLDHSRRFGQEIWKPLLALVLFLLLFELWFERRMARQRVSG
ncbi:MAG: BatA domain-containing protein [Verrucomicrobiota bacterium]|nr:BatA domain-containing protein [Verrucomicrobiota bacterium]